MSDMIASPKEQSHKNVKLAVLLQCFPLIGAASCVFGGGIGPPLTIIPFFLWWSVLFWGFGYVYLRRVTRFLLTLLLGPVLAFGSCFASFSGVNYDFEHCPTYGYPCSDVKSASRAAVQTGLIVAAAVLLLAVDAWRLAEADNAALDAAQPPDGEPTEGNGEEP